MLEVYVVPWALRILFALLIIVIGRMLASFISRLAKKSLNRSGMDKTLVDFLTTVTFTVLLIAVFLSALDTLGVNITSLLAIVAAAGLAIGLALKESLANFIAGVMIIFFKPFKAGDSITTRGTSGIVDQIGIFCTFMHTPDNQRIIIPNGQVLGGTIVNDSTFPNRRIDLTIRIKPDESIGKAREVILGLLEADSRVLKNPEPTVSVTDFTGSGISLQVRPWVRAEDLSDLRSDLLENIKISFEQVGISVV